MDEQPIRILDLFSGIGGFALAAEIANAMADAERQQDHGERRVDLCGRLHEAAQCDNGEAGADCACGCGEDVADATSQRPGTRRAESAGQQRTARTSRRRFAPLAHSEIEPFACAVYHRHFPDSVCLGPVQNVTRAAILERCGVLPDVVCGGFPCQPHSCAGKRLASADERDLWGECRRILGEIRPRFALFENVGGLLTSESGLFFNRVLSDLAALRFACQWQVVPAAAVGAPHRRDRVWLLCWDELANTRQIGLPGQAGIGELGRIGPAINGASLLWPALDGHWPSRPGEAQHGWEPPRTVGGALGLCADGLPAAMGGVGDEVFWRTPSAEEAGAKVETLYTKDGEPARPGERAYRLQPDGRLVLQSVTINQQVEMVGGSHESRDWPEVHNRVAQLKAAGNAIVPEVAAIFLNAIRRAF